MSGDVEVNPGPKRNYCQSHCFSICHKFDIVCLSETFFNSEILTDDENLQIPGYSIARDDHPSNTKRGDVCVYYKTSLPLSC